MKASIRTSLSILGLGVASYACSSDPPAATPATTEGPSTSAEAQPLVIGAVLSVTGNLGPFGQGQQNALRVAESQINAFGGVLGRPVQFKIVDDASKSDAAGSALADMLGMTTKVVVGPTGSPQASAIHKQAFDARTLLISPSASTPDLSNAEPARDRWFFRTATSHALQARAIAIRVSKGLPDAAACNTVAIVHAEDSYGTPIANGIATALASYGKKVVADVSVPTQAKADYGDEASRVIAASPDCQIIVTFPDVGIGYLRSFAARPKPEGRDWSKLVTVGANGLASSAFVENGRTNPADPASPTIGEGAFVVNLDLAPVTPSYQAFKNIYTAQFPLKEGQKDPPGYAANAYDAAILAALAIEKARTAEDSAKIREALFDVSAKGQAFGPADVGDALLAIRSGVDVDYVGASGPVDLDEHGDVLGGYVVLAVQGGKLVPLPSETVGVEELQ